MKSLVVEDEPISQQLLMAVLSDYGVTHGATSGREALAKFQEAHQQQEHYDLVCLDIMMPGIDGQETLMKIRQIEEDKGIAAAKRVNVVMVTALGDDKNIIEAYRNGTCQAYLTKPLTPRTLKTSLYELGLLAPNR